MNKFTNPLSNIKIASPCRADWNEMIGDDRRRFCGECKLNVYNLSGMSKTEAENLLLNSEGRLCVRFYKRADGTVLTKDCPVGWQAVKQRVSKTAAAFASLVFGVLSGLGLTAFFSESNEEHLMGKIAYQSTPKPKATPKETPIPLMGVVAIPSPSPKSTPKPKEKDEFIMGEIAVPAPSPKAKPKAEKDLAGLIEKVKAQVN
jgi:hypothetical protein